MPSKEQSRDLNPGLGTGGMYEGEKEPSVFKEAKVDQND